MITKRTEVLLVGIEIGMLGPFAERSEDADLIGHEHDGILATRAEHGYEKTNLAPACHEAEPYAGLT